MRGPSAFGGGWRRFADLTWMIGATNYKLTYFGSALGYLWSLVRPLLLFGVLYVVFSQIVKFGEDIRELPDDAAAEHRAVHLLPGGHVALGDVGGGQRGRWCARCTSRAW